MFDFLAKLFSPTKTVPRGTSNQGEDETEVDEITVEPELTPEQKATISATLTACLRNGWAKIPTDRIPALQERIEDLVFSGARAGRVARVLTEEYRLDKQRAAQAAHLAANLVLAKSRENHARKAGSTRYRWWANHDARVCPRCRALDGQIFSWDKPPEGGHPRECLTCPDSAGCRCGAIPIMGFDESA